MQRTSIAKVARPVAMAVLAIAGIGLGGCARVRDHQGYVIESQLVNGIQAGIDNRDSVGKTLGRPSLASEFDGAGSYYYWARDTTQFAASNPRPTKQTMLEVRFAPSGDVTSVQKTGLETIRNVSLYGRKTPTLGRKHNFFNDLFGNIGAGGANAGSVPTADKPTR